MFVTISHWHASFVTEIPVQLPQICSFVRELRRQSLGNVEDIEDYIRNSILGWYLCALGRPHKNCTGSGCLERTKGGLGPGMGGDSCMLTTSPKRHRGQWVMGSARGGTFEMGMVLGLRSAGQGPEHQRHWYDAA